MTSVYIGELLRRVFFPTTRGADYLSILVPVLLAAVAKFAGVEVSENAAVDALAYVGAFTLLLFIVRLFVTTPYAMWGEQVGDVAKLKLALAKPERLVMERLVKHRAKARAKLAAKLEDLQTYAYVEKWDGTAENAVSEMLEKIRRLEAEAGLPEAYLAARQRLQVFIMREANRPNADLGDRLSTITLRLLQKHLMGELTAEALALQLPIGTEREKQQ